MVSLNLVDPEQRYRFLAFTPHRLHTMHGAVSDREAAVGDASKTSRVGLLQYGIIIILIDTIIVYCCLYCYIWYYYCVELAGRHAYLGGSFISTTGIHDMTV